MKLLLGQVLTAREQTKLQASPELIHANGPAKRQLSITCQSGGFKAGNFALIEILADGEGQSPRVIFGRGLNIVVIDPLSGQVIETGSFDTHVSKEEASEFAKTIEWIEPGYIIIVVSKDECSENMTEAAKAACESIGSGLIRNLKYRDSWCIIGEKGALPGTVPEAYRSAVDGPTEAIKRIVDLKPDRVLNNTSLTPQSRFKMMLPSNGRWLRRRKTDGALNRVPSDFYPKVWQLLSKTDGIMIGKAFLPRDPTIYEKTPEELNFGNLLRSNSLE